MFRKKCNFNPNVKKICFTSGILPNKNNDSEICFIKEKFLNILRRRGI